MATCCDDFEEGTDALYNIEGKFQKRNRTYFFWFGRFLEYDIFFWPPAAIILRRKPTLHAILKESFRRQTKRIFLVEYVLFSKSHVFFCHLLREFRKAGRCSIQCFRAEKLNAFLFVLVFFRNIYIFFVACCENCEGEPECYTMLKESLVRISV